MMKPKQWRRFLPPSFVAVSTIQNKYFFITVTVLKTTSGVLQSWLLDTKEKNQKVQRDKRTWNL